MGQHHTQRTIRRLLAVTAAVALVAGMGGSASVAAAPPEGNAVQPDAIVRNGDGTGAVGGNVYNTTGAGQTKNRSVPAGTTLVYQFRMQNDSDGVQFLTPKGCASTTHFKVKYFLPQPAPNRDINITSTITSGGLSVGRNPGQHETYRLVIKVKGTAPRGATLTCRLKVSINQKGPDGPPDVARVIVRRS